VENHKPHRDSKRGKEDSAHPWLTMLVRIFQRLCVGIALGGALSGIVAVVQGRNEWAEVAAAVALYALVMATLAEWVMRFIKKSLP
jgi:hypothetical protein